MRRYGIIQPLWLSFYSGDLYDDVRRNWGNAVFLYLLVLLAITWIPITVMIDDMIRTWADVSAKGVVEQFPEVIIENGKVSVDASEPVIIRDPATDQAFMIIDVTGQYTSLSGTEASILVKEEEILVRQSPSEVRTYRIPPEGERIVINRDVLYQWLDALTNVLSLILYPVLVVFSYAYRIIQVLIYGGIGLLIVQHFNATMVYPVLVRLAVISITPAVILDTFHTMMDVSLPFWWPICFLLSMSYLYFAIKVNVTTEDG